MPVKSDKWIKEMALKIVILLHFKLARVVIHSQISISIPSQNRSSFSVGVIWNRSEFGT